MQLAINIAVLAAIYALIACGYVLIYRVSRVLNLAHGERPQDVVAAQTWQGTRLAAGGRWALVTCVVAPEFRLGDFELGGCEALGATYPAFADGIRALTRAVPSAGKL